MKKYNKYYCQNCGCDTKYIETLLDDEFTIDENGAGQFCGFADEHEHTGVEKCKDCGKDWTGLEPLEIN